MTLSPLDATAARRNPRQSRPRGPRRCRQPRGSARAGSGPPRPPVRASSGSAPVRHARRGAPRDRRPEHTQAVAPAGLRPPGRHLAGGLCHRRWAGVAGGGPQPLPPGDVYRQRLMPCRARGGPRQSADGGLRVTDRATMQTARHRHPLQSPRVWRAVSGGASSIARPSGALWALPGRRGRTGAWGGSHARACTHRAPSPSTPRYHSRYHSRGSTPAASPLAGTRLTKEGLSISTIEVNIVLPARENTLR